MKKLLPIITLAFACFICSKANAQYFTEKDFKLLLDGKDFYSDSSISVNELLKLREVTGNFSWMSIKEVIISIDFRTDAERDHVYDGTWEHMCSGNVICDEAKAKIKNLRPTSWVIISAYKATNKSGVKINIPDLVLHIK
jgi:hypothetical protein